MSDPSAIVQAAPIVASVSLWVNAAIIAATNGAIALALALVAKYLGLSFGPDAATKLDSVADKLVSSAVAAAENNLASGKFDVGSALVVSLTSQLAAEAPVIVGKLGYTPNDLANVVTAAIGRAQASMTRVTPPVAAPAAK